MDQDKPDLSAFMPEGWTGKYPPCQIQVSTDGEMSSQGRPMVHPTIIQLIYDSVRLEDGHYVITIDGQTCELEVADTFHVVKRVEFNDESAVITLNDATSETLDPGSLSLGDDGIVYCRVKDGAFPARFGRAAYYQLADKIVEQGEGFALVLGDKSWPLIQTT
ncbi:MAG: DUF1285 domain-containing protein [Desulfarculaceae bacterium]|nr:DUF1285 domain-containing protein [Desulfarculaceae bacterium]MCF8048620.1 DUF1285 domain-containing protein [Desulfarculaceae bacterium]MCF8096716.1 DUF1285 domain-containing protein [Desulfarculaceae bacterium]MCF8123012.1 DUF1285 domain-containing protein [Desulfarculaceae bacterium]